MDTDKHGLGKESKNMEQKNAFAGVIHIRLRASPSAE